MTINRLNQGVTNQVLVKAVSGQTTPLLELQDSTGAVVSSIGPTGVLAGTISQPQGLVHIETRTLSAVASESFNDVFSATYNTYKIICRLESSAAGDVGIRYRLRVAGADATGADYVSQLLQGNDSSAFALRQTSLTSLQIGATTNSTDFSPLCSFELNNPFLTVKTNHISSFVTANPIVGFFGGLHSLTNSYTGITFFGSSGNLTGTISIYGYAKA